MHPKNPVKKKNNGPRTRLELRRPVNERGGSGAGCRAHTFSGSAAAGRKPPTAGAPVQPGKTEPVTTTKPSAGVMRNARSSALTAPVAASTSLPVVRAAASRSSTDALRGESTGVTTTRPKRGKRICASSAAGLSLRQPKTSVKGWPLSSCETAARSAQAPAGLWPTSSSTSARLPLPATCSSRAGQTVSRIPAWISIGSYIVTVIVS